MKNTPYSIRNNEIYGDLKAWMDSHAEDNEADLRRLKRNLRLAREEELTPRQKQVIEMYFEQEMNVTQIARALGVNKSTVSRTLRRGKRRLKHCLHYSI